MAMLQMKEELIQKYYDYSIEALNSLDNENVEDIDHWLSKRDEIANLIDAFDRGQGSIKINEVIRNQIIKIQEINQQLLDKMQELKTEATDQIREIRSAKQLQNTYYDNDGPTAEGIFYDKRK